MTGAIYIKLNGGRTTEIINTQANKGSPLPSEEVSYQITPTFTLIRCSREGKFLLQVPRFLIYIIKNGGRIKGEGKTPKTSKNTSQRRKPQGPGKGLEAPRSSVPVQYIL